MQKCKIVLQTQYYYITELLKVKKNRFITRCSQEQKKLLTSKLDAAFSILVSAGLIYFIDFILFFEIRC